MRAVADVVIGVDAQSCTETSRWPPTSSAGSWRQDRAGDRRGACYGARVGRSLARPALDAGGLPGIARATGLEGALVRASEQVRAARPDADDGRCSTQRPPARKSDAIHALAVARTAWREPDLPTACLDGPSRQIRWLIDHRDDLVAERTGCRAGSAGICTRSRPTSTSPPAASSSSTLSSASTPGSPSIDGLIATIARELLERVRQLMS